MKVIFVTANLPHGTDEAFIVPEIDELIRMGHEVLVIPRSPTGPVLHTQSLEGCTRRETLLSPRVLRRAMRVGIRSPFRTSKGIAQLLLSRAPGVAIKNLAVVPKALWLASVAQEWGADHIHSHWAGTTATLAMLSSIVSGIPWSFTAHRWDVVENNLLAEKVKRASFARFISEDGLRMAKEIGIGTAANARVLFMGVKVPAPVERSTGRWPIVVCPARMVDVKGHRFLIEAWRILRDRGSRGELWLAGDGELRPELERLCESMGLQYSIKFLGTLAHEDLLRIYREVAVTAVVLASNDLGHGLHEGIPVALVEAMSYGIPVVATRTGGTPELVKPGLGLLVPPADAPALADALETLLHNRILAQALGESGRRHIVQTHDIVAVTSELARAIETSAAKGSSVSTAA